MFNLTINVAEIWRHTNLLFITMFAVLVLSAGVFGQTPTPQSSPEALYNGYKVTSVTEFGYRWRSLDGNVNKYRSDLNYDRGFRSFDTNLLMQRDDGKGTYFDSLLISNSGWGSDPQGYTRVNMEKTGFYKFTSTVRRVAYFNNLSNYALGEHKQDWKTTLGDFDIQFLPQNERIRFNFGGGFANTSGPGMYTVRAYSDEFPITSDADSLARDFRVGADGKLWGFDWGLSQGFRTFKDRSSYILTAPNAGNNTGNSSALATFSRNMPIDGHGYFTQFNLHRTFAKKLDFTGRIIYSSTNTRSSMTELITGRDNSNNVVILDQFVIAGDAKRPQTRADLGATYMATDKFRISNTFTFDQFAVNGGEALDEALFFRNNAGTISTTRRVASSAYRVNAYQRYTNTVEGDYQFANWISAHLGYRYTKRNVDVTGYDRSRTTNTINPPPSPAPTPSVSFGLIEETENNSTNTVIAGMRIKPVNNWVVHWDVEHGSADNVFTRLENYKYTNFKFRSRVSLKTFVFNVSAISKDNNNPSRSFDPVSVPFGADVRTRIYSGDVNWAPVNLIQFSAGYTYRHLTSKTDIRVIGGTPVQGVSQFFERDHYLYGEVTAKPHKRLSLFGTYRYDRDKGQGDRVATGGIQNIITSYPMQFKTPEVRAAIRLTQNVDWNIGYQYYDYKDVQTPTQNYRAHLPYTSLRIYLGGGAADR
ncbi:MAG: hypothetical protein IPL32_02920 [Chloracidobacterium sp.]|nr:hypothetical protein [Chloracidobacterium sp.]